MNLFKANILNLTSLWTIGGLVAGHYIEEPGYRLSVSDDGEWPNKLWFTKPPDLAELENIQTKWDLKKISITVWENIKKQELLLTALGFEEKLTQVAMSQALDKAFNLANKLDIYRVCNKSLAKTWSRLFQESFGYSIDPGTVQKTMKHIDYFVAMTGNLAVGTAVLFIDQYGTAGIHSMGIIPSQRRKGYAEELLKSLLIRAQMIGARYATLQASDIGKGLYLKAGFQQDFKIKAFIKNKK